MGNEAWSSCIESVLIGDASKWSLLENPVQSFQVEMEEAYSGRSHQPRWFLFLIVKQTLAKLKSQRT